MPAIHADGLPLTPAAQPASSPHWSMRVGKWLLAGQQLTRVNVEGGTPDPAAAVPFAGRRQRFEGVVRGAALWSVKVHLIMHRWVPEDPARPRAGVAGSASAVVDTPAIHGH